MHIERTRALRGPNLWSKNTSLEMLVLCEECERMYDRHDALETRIRAHLPNIGSIRATGLDHDVTLAHFLAKLTLSLQIEAGSPVAFTRVVDSVSTGTFRVIVQYEEEELARLALKKAEAILNAALKSEPFDTEAALAELKELYEDIKMGPSTSSIVRAAVAQGIPFRRLTQGSLVQLGWGSKQRRIQAAEIDATSAIAESIAQDKDLTKTLLHAAGLPVPEGRIAHTYEEACEAFDELGCAVVVKPYDGNQGKGVTVNVRDKAHLKVAFDTAAEFGSGVPIVERFVPGHDYRFLVVGNQLVAAARREPPSVVGDGVHTIEELVAIENRNPLRSEGHGSALSKIKLDAIAVARIQKQGFETDSVPPKGVRVVLRNNANLSTGGVATDITDDVHPALANTVIEAAQLIGIDICGVDVMCERVNCSLEEQGGAIIEINAAPGLRMHLAPSYGKPRDVGKAVIAAMFAPQETARIPLVAVTGTNGKTTTVRLIEHMLKTHGMRVGFTGTEGVYVDGHLVDTGDCSGPRSAHRVLMHPEADAAVLECARGGMLREGLGFDMCDVGIVTNIGEGDHLGLNFIDSVEDLALLKSVLIQNVSPNGLAVLNADDRHTVEMAKRSPGRVLFFSTKTDNPIVNVHKAQGQSVLMLQGDRICLSHDGEEAEFPLSEIPLTHNGLFLFQIQNVMCAIAAAAGLKLPMETVRQALATFNSDPNTVPGRLNVFYHNNGTIIADYGHNPDAIGALIDSLQHMKCSKRQIVISAAGDRRDIDIIDQGRRVGEFFDDIILYEDACQRGRPDGETLALLQQGISEAASRPAGQSIREIRGEFKAIDLALKDVTDGSLTLILIDQVQEALAHLSAAITK